MTITPNNTSPRIAYYEGQESYWDGTKCPYEPGTECYEEWVKGWRSEDIREQCREDWNGE